ILGVAPLPPPISTTIEAHCRPSGTENGCSYGGSRSTSPAGAMWAGTLALMAIAVRRRKGRRSLTTPNDMSWRPLVAAPVGAARYHFCIVAADDDTLTLRQWLMLV